MNSGRSNKPLFEVLSQHAPRGTEVPVARPEHADPRSAPMPAQEISPAPARAPEPVSHSKPLPKPEIKSLTEDQPDPETLSRPVVTIPLSTVYTAIAFAGALILIAWIGGFQMGIGSAQDESIRADDPPNILTEPGNQASNPGQLPNQQPEVINQGSPQIPGLTNGLIPGQSPTDPVSQPAAQTNQPSSTGTILTASGLLDHDPREPGLNYLVLGTFTREMTQEAIDFLAASNSQAIGIPQPSGQYRLISIGLGVPGGSQFSAMATQRVAHKRNIAQIGARWVRDQQGGSDFSQPQWTKFQP